MLYVFKYVAVYNRNFMQSNVTNSEFREYNKVSECEWLLTLLEVTQGLVYV